MLCCFLKKEKENGSLSEVWEIKVNGVWLEHKWAKCLGQIYDMLSMKAES